MATVWTGPCMWPEGHPGPIGAARGSPPAAQRASLLPAGCQGGLPTARKGKIDLLPTV